MRRRASKAASWGIGRELVEALPCQLSLHRFSGLRVLASARGAVLVLRRANAAKPPVER